MALESSGVTFSPVGGKLWEDLADSAFIGGAIFSVACGWTGGLESSGLPAAGIEDSVSVVGLPARGCFGLWSAAGALACSGGTPGLEAGSAT